MIIEKNQTMTNTACYHLYVESKNIKQLNKYNKKEKNRPYLVAQWIRNCLSMQWICVPSLVQEDSTCQGVTKFVRHNY